jgi:hypothetical protein
MQSASEGRPIWIEYRMSPAGIPEYLVTFATTDGERVVQLDEGQLQELGVRQALISGLAIRLP